MSLINDYLLSAIIIGIAMLIAIIEAIPLKSVSKNFS